MGDHNVAFENIILNGDAIVNASKLDFYACAFVKEGKGWREGEREEQSI